MVKIWNDRMVVHRNILDSCQTFQVSSYVMMKSRLGPSSFSRMIEFLELSGMLDVEEEPLGKRIIRRVRRTEKGSNYSKMVDELVGMMKDDGMMNGARGEKSVIYRDVLKTASSPVTSDYISNRLPYSNRTVTRALEYDLMPSGMVEAKEFSKLGYDSVTKYVSTDLGKIYLKKMHQIESMIQ